MIFPADPAGVDLAAACLRGGGVIAIPTDTVFGLAVAAEGSRPAARLAAIKGRPLGQPAILMAASLADLQPYVRWSGGALGFAERHWPGPLTLIVAATARGRRLGGPGTIGIRVPDLAIVQGLLARAGPCATTSANRHGEPPLPDAAAALRALPLLHGALRAPAGRRGTAAASSILDCTGQRPVLVRVGALDAGALGLADTGRAGVGRGGTTGSG